MHVFYNEAFDFRVVINISDFHSAVEKLREYLKEKSYGSHQLTVNDFIYESVDLVLQ